MIFQKNLFWFCFFKNKGGGGQLPQQGSGGPATQASVTTQIPPSVVLAMNYLNEPGSHAQRNILKSSGDNAIWFV